MMMEIKGDKEKQMQQQQGGQKEMKDDDDDDDEGRGYTIIIQDIIIGDDDDDDDDSWDIMKKKEKKMMTVFSLHFGIFIVQGYQDNDDVEQMMENTIMKLQVMMDEARKQQDGKNNDSIVGIINIPEDVFIFHIVGYLNQKEVVSGLSETNKLLWFDEE
jgi:hypothetical protein